MLVHEAKLAAMLNHKCIVQVFNLGRAEAPSDSLYIAMEYVEGFNLNVLLRLCSERNVALPVEFALGIVTSVLEGLHYAHRRTDDEGAPLGIVHRDVSPSNVLVSFEGEIKLCDFGIAHANMLVRTDDSEALKGKAGYMSPEHARGESLDARADVFAAGILLWELLSGRRLYRPKSDVPLIEQARHADVPKLEGLQEKGIQRPEELERIVTRALAKDRDNRYPSAFAFLRDVEEYVAVSALVTSPLRLRGWLEESFGTNLVLRRRENERQLPKLPSKPNLVLPHLPISLAPVSSGAMRAFRMQLRDPTDFDAYDVEGPLEATGMDGGGVVSEDLDARGHGPFALLRKKPWVLVLTGLAFCAAIAAAYFITR